MLEVNKVGLKVAVQGAVIASPLVPAIQKI